MTSFLMSGGGAVPVNIRGGVFAGYWLYCGVLEIQGPGIEQY